MDLYRTFLPVRSVGRSSTGFVFPEVISSSSWIRGAGLLKPRSSASFTLSFRPANSESLSASIAFSPTSRSAKVTKANPRGLPVSRSRGRCNSRTGSYGENSSRTSGSVASFDKFPTNNFIDLNQLQQTTPVPGTEGRWKAEEQKNNQRPNKHLPTGPGFSTSVNVFRVYPKRHFSKTFLRKAPSEDYQNTQINPRNNL